jgi:hypothetical protein
MNCVKQIKQSQRKEFLNSVKPRKEFNGDNDLLQYG